MTITKLYKRNMMKPLQYSNIPVVILAGGKGSRILEYTKTIPKPLIRVNRVPILIRIIDQYISYGFKEILVATGYLNNVIHDYFSKNYKKNRNYYEYKKDAKVKLIFTGLNTMTGGRILRLKKQLISKTKIFCLTYGDGVSDINFQKLISFHLSHKRIATLTSVRPPARFGYLKLKQNNVIKFGEKKNVDVGWINGGFFVFHTNVFKYIDHNLTFLEKEPLENLAFDKQLMAYKHNGFWQCMDTLRDKIFLDDYFKKYKQ